MPSRRDWIERTEPLPRDLGAFMRVWQFWRVSATGDGAPRMAVSAVGTSWKRTLSELVRFGRLAIAGAGDSHARRDGALGSRNDRGQLLSDANTVGTYRPAGG